MAGTNTADFDFQLGLRQSSCVGKWEGDGNQYRPPTQCAVRGLDGHNDFLLHHKGNPLTSIIFTTTRGPISWVIRYVSKSPVSHCAVGFDIDGVSLVLEADIGGVHLSIREKFLKANPILVAEYACPEGTRVAPALKVLGKEYDYAGLVGFGIVTPIRKWLGKRVHNPFNQTRAVICSELVRALNLDVFSGLDVMDVTPQDLYLVCGTLPAVR